MELQGLLLLLFCTETCFVLIRRLSAQTLPGQKQKTDTVYFLGAVRLLGESTTTKERDEVSTLMFFFF